jgi:hypothetical protein
VDFPDVLLAVIRHIGEALRTRENIELRLPVLDKLILNVVNKVRGTNLSKIEVNAEVVKLTADIKSSPDVRKIIREALEPNVSNLLDAANTLLDDAVIQLKQKGYRDLVLIVDNLDRIVLRDLPDGSNTHDRLFVNRGAQLNALRCYTIYTLPISIVFTPTARALRSIFGDGPKLLPMVKVCNREGGANPAGLQAMCDMVCRRLEAAGVASDAVFDKQETLKYLCRMSGGHARGLMQLMRAACITSGSLPLTHAVAEQVVQQASNDFERALNKPEYYDTLRQIAKEKSLPGSDNDQLLLYILSVLEYLNGGQWYAVHPAVQEIEKFKKPPRPTKNRKTKE